MPAPGYSGGGTAPHGGWRHPRGAVSVTSSPGEGSTTGGEEVETPAGAGTPGARPSPGQTATKTATRCQVACAVLASKGKALSVSTDHLGSPGPSALIRRRAFCYPLADILQRAFASIL